MAPGRAADEFWAGDVIAGSLRVEALLGEGGAGAVYRICDERSGRKLALKQLRAPTDERRALVTSLFEREYHTLSQLAHPRIIEVYDYGFAQGCAYYTMELLDGEDMHERGKLPWRTACALLRDVASSLAIVHSRGLVHRDVSARNVRCTSDGRAKLIDFGAMAPMGVSHRLVGTPPFVPPEALQLQALDGRADLYSLGALAYWTLTGRYAYPARSFPHLRELWRNPALGPRHHEPELPEALSELVMALLRLDRAERPSTAADVMERLSSIAGLPLHELPQVSRAYLIMPKLVGRDNALQQARGQLLRAMNEGRGDALLIHGAAGSGRSRFLDACTLEAKLLGATVLRAGAQDAARGDYGVARALCTQLLCALPDLCVQSAQPRLALLGHVLPELLTAAVPAAAPGAPPAGPERRHLQAALRDWLLAIARSKHIVVAVDDFAAADEPSAALIGALAHGAKRRHLNVLLTTRSDDKDSSALTLLRELSSTLSLQLLGPEQTEQLLRSLFGDVPRLVALADRIQQLSAGNPGRIMLLAKHLVARGLVRYEAGSWALPVELAVGDLPRSEREALSRRLSRLPSDARALAEVLSLTDPSALSLPDYAGLTDDGDSGRAFAALDELVAAGVLRAEGERYRLAQADALVSLAQALPAERRRELHGRLARALRSADRPALLQLHMLCGGQEREAFARLTVMGNQLDSGLLEVLLCAVQTAEQSGVTFDLQLPLQLRLLRLCAATGQCEPFERYAGPLMQRLERDSGLLDWFELAHAAPAARLPLAFARAQERYDAAPPALQGLPPRQSMTQLVTLYSACSGMAGISFDLPLLERLRSLSAWCELSPVIDAVQRSIEVQRAIQSGRYELAHERCAQLMERLQPHSSGQDVTLGYLRRGSLYTMGLIAAAKGQPACERWIAELERLPGHRGNVWRVRMIYELMRGNLERARDCQRRAELLDLQDTGGVALPGATARLELMIAAYTDDIVGVKRAIERSEVLAASYPRRKPALCAARSHYKRLQGDFAAALQELASGLVSSAPARHPDWGMVADAQLMALRGAGREAEAVELGLGYLQTCGRLELSDDANLLQRSVAEALIKLGRLEQARVMIDGCIAWRLQVGVQGVWLGLAYETRARVAIAMRDEPGLLQYAQLCADAYRDGARNASLSAKYAQLMREGAAAGVGIAPDQAALQAQADAEQDVAHTVYSRMLTCISPAERAQKGLQLLLEATGARAGHLFGLRSGKLRWLSSADEVEPPPALKRALEDYLRQQFERESVPESGAAASPLETFFDDMGREFEPLLLCGEHHGEFMVAGVAALHHGDDERTPPLAAMLQAVIEALIAEDIVDPITRVA